MSYLYLYMHFYYVLNIISVMCLFYACLLVIVVHGMLSILLCICMVLDDCVCFFHASLCVKHKEPWNHAKLIHSTNFDRHLNTPTICPVNAQ